MKISCTLSPCFCKQGTTSLLIQRSWIAANLIFKRKGIWEILSQHPLQIQRQFKGLRDAKGRIALIQDVRFDWKTVHRNRS